MVMGSSSRRVFNCLDTSSDNVHASSMLPTNRCVSAFSHGLASCEFALWNNPTTRADGCRAFTRRATVASAGAKKAVQNGTMTTSGCSFTTSRAQRYHVMGLMESTTSVRTNWDWRPSSY